ncbi:hypothetical protein Ancab_021431 [Ancistrocladus abbreviatus]
MKPFSPLIKPNQVCSSPLSSSRSGFSDPKKVYLHDWWLMKPQGEGIAIGGSLRRGPVGRLFYSAAIMKRHDTSTLETSDGFILFLSGFINRSRTQQNGFPSEVCSHFLVGFPYDWESYVAQCSVEETSRHSGFKKFDKSSETTNNFLSNEFSVSSIRDILVCTHGNHDRHVLRDHVLSAALEKINSVLGRTPARSEKSYVEQKCKNNDSGLTAADRSREELKTPLSINGGKCNSIVDRYPAHMKSSTENKCTSDNDMAAADARRVEKPQTPVSLITVVGGDSVPDFSLAEPKKSREEKKFESHVCGWAAAGRNGDERLERPVFMITMVGVNSAPNANQSNTEKSIVENKYQSHESGLDAVDRDQEKVLPKPDSSFRRVGGNGRKSRVERKRKSNNSGFAIADRSKEEPWKPVSPFATVGRTSVFNGTLANSNMCQGIIVCGLPADLSREEQRQMPFEMDNDIQMAVAGRFVHTRRKNLNPSNKEELHLLSDVLLNEGPVTEPLSPDNKRRSASSTQSASNGSPCRRSSRLKNLKRISLEDTASKSK